MPDETKAKQAEQRRIQQEEQLKRQQEAQDRELNTLVEGIKKAREDADEAISRLNTLSSELRVKARRASDNGYMMFASAHMRLAGALGQGVKRTTSMDRFLSRSKQEREEEERRKELENRLKEAKAAKQAAKKKVDELIQPTEDAFEELYGGMTDGE